MNELLFYRIALGAAGILFALFAAWTFRLSPGNLSRFEAWPRRRLPGMLIGWAALAICVPHAEVVSPGFLVPLLWPLAIAVPILGYFFVDYPLARALGGISILGAYYFIHKSFEFSALWSCRRGFSASPESGCRASRARCGTGSGFAPGRKPGVRSVPRSGAS